jgi:hypothetical protein
MTTEVTGEMPDFLRRAAAPPADPPAREPRQRRTSRRAAPAEPEAAKPTRAPRKPRAAKKEVKERAAVGTITISVKEYASHRVTAFQREFVKMHKILAPLPAKVRPQILDELKKVFG